MKQIEIAFKDEYLDLILRGQKSSTIRLGRRDYPSGTALLTSSHNCLRARILRCRALRVYDLTDQDAIRDGFSSLKDLLSALEEIYGSLDRGAEMTVVEFALETGTEEENIKDQQVP